MLIPIDTSDKVNWRTMNMGYNFQAQYIPLPSIIYPWKRFERAMINQKQNYNTAGTYKEDGTRQFVYNAYELIMDRFLYYFSYHMFIILLMISNNLEKV